MSRVMSFMVTPLIGALLAFLAMFALILSQNAGPNQNPADQQAIVYGS